eukprot:tig00021464_g21736.t1
MLRGRRRVRASPNKACTHTLGTPPPASRPGQRRNVDPICAAAPTVVQREIAGTGTGVLVEAMQSSPAPVPDRITKFLKAFYKFTRPHTIRGTILAVIAGTGRALWENRSRIDLRLVPKAIIGLVCLLCGNAFIVGINQIFDVDIDKVNKPFLPMASGEMGKNMAWFLVLACGTMGLGLTYLNFPGLTFKLFAFGTLLGTLYSVPPFRWRQNPIFAALSIATVRGFLLNFGVYYATTEALGVPFSWNPAVVFLTFFMSLFALVIAITKDLPDIEGDRMFSVKTFASKLGAKTMVNISAAILMVNYVAAIALPIMFRSSFKRWWLMIGVHAAIIAILLKRIQSVEETKTSLVQYYQFIWKLFYTEFLIYPFL